MKNSTGAKLFHEDVGCYADVFILSAEIFIGRSKAA
jgi:hypothetical protein